MRAVWNQHRRLFWTLACLVLGCVGYAAVPTQITQTSAVFHAPAQCLANTTTNPCTGWFQYWEDGSTVIRETPHVEVNAKLEVDFNQAVSGLKPATLHHYQFCGFGDQNVAQPGVCTGPLTGNNASGANVPGTMPNPLDLNAAVHFVTAGPTSKGTVDLGRVLSTADTDQTPISRDAGLSVLVSTNPPKALWIFADTQQSFAGLIPFSTAALGPFTPGGLAPTALNELPTPPAAPQPGRTSPAAFFPPPAPLTRLNGTRCAVPGEAYEADWVSGGAKLPGSSTLLLTYGEICVEVKPALAFTTERIALAHYDPETNRFLRIDRPFVAAPLNAGVPPRRALASPIFASDGFLYLFGSECVGSDGFACKTLGAVYVARVAANPSAWSNAASYQWWTGTAWSSSSSSAANVVPGVNPISGGVHVADYAATTGRKYAMLVQSAFGSGGFDVYEATSPTGPWTRKGSGRPPDACFAPGHDFGFGCYAIAGHPELSTPARLVFSWLSPDDRNAYPHIRVGAIDW